MITSEMNLIKPKLVDALLINTISRLRKNCKLKVDVILHMCK